MTPSTKRTLLLIAVFFIAVVGSFVWFVITWDPEREKPVGQLPDAVERVIRS